MGREKEIWKPGNMLYPVPVVMVSCQRPGEIPNIITVAWAGTVCTNPPMLSISVRPERLSYGMIARTKEFVVNLTTKELVRACDYCGVKSGRDVDKFKETGLLAEAATYVKAPLIAQSPVNIECRVKQIVKLGSHDMFIGEIVGINAKAEFIENGKINIAKANLITYLGSQYYVASKKIADRGICLK